MTDSGRHVLQVLFSTCNWILFLGELSFRPNFLYFDPFSEKITFRLLDDSIPFLDSLFGDIGCGAKITLLGSIAYIAEVRDSLMREDWRGADVVPSSVPQILAPTQDLGAGLSSFPILSLVCLPHSVRPSPPPPPLKPHPVATRARTVSPPAPQLPRPDSAQRLEPGRRWPPAVPASPIFNLFLVII